MFASTRFEGIDFGCLGGTRWAHVGVDGGLRPCPYVPISYGNVYEEGFARVWKKLSAFRETVKEIDVCPMQNTEFVNNLINNLSE
jgi:MoaA/NifB/PqqE/SkfB family radical SAM enzyme